MAFVLDEYFPFDPGFGASANATRWRKMAALWQADGVISGLTAGISGGTLTVQPGALLIKGYYGELAAAKSFSPIGASGTLVAQANLPTDNEYIQVTYRPGIVDYGAGGYQQDSNVWEMPLWLVDGGNLIDLRTLLTPSGPVCWSDQVVGAQTVNGGATVDVPVLSARIPHAGWALVQGSALLTFTSQQTATCSIYYETPAGGENHATSTIAPAVAAGAVPVSISGRMPVTSGRKILGWRVVAGSGAAVSISQMTVTATLISAGAQG